MFFNNKETKINFDALPTHIAIIMDGNGRWASKRMLMKKAGHKAGAQALEKIVRESDKMGIKHLTVYAFSTENWKRSADEVKGIMDLIREYLQNYIDKADKENVVIDILGDKTKLDEDIQEKIRILENLSMKNTGMHFHIALNYGGRYEILNMVKNIVDLSKADLIKTSDITEEIISNNLYTKDIPDPDLLIRTSGEQRISNFLLWQLAYSEFYFTDKLWPDFSVDDLKEAIYLFQSRDRRFGGRK